MTTYPRAAKKTESKKDRLDEAQAETPDHVIAGLVVPIVRFRQKHHYGLIVEQHILAPTSSIYDQKDLNAFHTALTDDRNHLLLSLIWKESDYCTDEHLKAAGASRQFEGVALTRNGIASELCKRMGPVDDILRATTAIQREVGRVIDAAEAYGLVEPDASRRGETRDNYKPIRATLRMHRLMVALGRDYLQQYQSTFVGKPGTAARVTNENGNTSGR